MRLLVACIILGLASAGQADAQNVASAKRQMIQESISRYSGNCPCPFSRASNGSRCGGRSAWSRPGGASPLCYGDDISDSMVRSWMQRQGMSVSRDVITDAERQMTQAVQAQLNRLGCDLGTPDGVIGPRSRSALREFSDASGQAFQVSDFRSRLFLRRLEAIQNRVCQ